MPTPTGSTLGFRIPDHPFVLQLLKKFARPLASTSANRSGEANALNTDDALTMLTGEVDVFVDGGAISPDQEASTVVFASEDDIKILRHGPIGEAKLRAAIK